MGGDPLLERSDRAEPIEDDDGARRRSWVVLSAAIMAVFIGWAALSGRDAEPAPSARPEVTAPVNSTTPGRGGELGDASPEPTAGSRFATPGDDWWVVNPARPVPSDYEPAELVIPDVPTAPGAENTRVTPAVAGAFEDLVRAAIEDGHALQLTSGYRSFDDQQRLYDQFVRDFGPDLAATRVAVPGASEHQTGLAVDVGVVGLSEDELFGDTSASRWVRDHAHRYGFIVRYPPGKADVTGYTAEPWHLRYVGAELAAELVRTGLTMEEHFGLVPSQPGGL